MSHAHTLDRRQLLGLMSAAATGILLPAWSGNAAAQTPGWLPKSPGPASHQPRPPT